MFESLIFGIKYHAKKEQQQNNQKFVEKCWREKNCSLIRNNSNEHKKKIEIHSSMRTEQFNFQKSSWCFSWYSDWDYQTCQNLCFNWYTTIQGINLMMKMSGTFWKRRSINEVRFSNLDTFDSLEIKKNDFFSEIVEWLCETLISEGQSIILSNEWKM